MTSRGVTPTETSWLVDAPTHHGGQAFWGKVVSATWPAAARQVAVAHAARLSRCVAELKFAGNWQSRPGIAELLAAATALGLPIAVVSNTICGAVHRDFLASSRLASHFVVQLYSDEQRVRKPNPELVWRTTAALGVSSADCWFVGDTLSRDVLAARRAGCGAAVLMRWGRVERPRIQTQRYPTLWWPIRTTCAHSSPGSSEASRRCVDLENPEALVRARTQREPVPAEGATGP